MVGVFVVCSRHLGIAILFLPWCHLSCSSLNHGVRVLRTCQSLTSLTVLWGRNERPFFLFCRQIFLALSFIGEKKASCEKILENRLTRLFSSTIRNVIRSQYVWEKIVHRASFLTGEFFLTSLLVGVEFPCFVNDQALLFSGIVVFQQFDLFFEHYEHRIFA